MAVIEHLVYRPSIEVEFETRAKPQLLPGEEFLMQWMAGWDMIHSSITSAKNKKAHPRNTNRLPHPIL